MREGLESVNDAARALLEEGLDHYGRGGEEAAIECWQRVLGLVPGHPEALEYLDAAGVEPAPSAQIIDLDEHRPRPRTLPPPTSVLDSPKLLGLVEHGDFEEALEMLYEARSEDPRDSSLSRSIRHLKLHLAKSCLKKVGGLDVILERSGEGEGRGPEENTVLRLVDGVSSVSDILRMSRLDQLRTIKALADLSERAVLHARDVDELLVSKAPLPSPWVEAPPSATHPVLPRSSPPSGSAEAESLDEEDAPYAKVFSEAMDAYFDQDFVRARAGLERCCALRPDDQRALHNLERLKALDKQP